ncbi:MAG TPA: type II secretion system protein [Clostridiaceae bacterium]|nr:type II secretion system protein [Clostridiaceae bacterium]
MLRNNRGYTLVEVMVTLTLLTIFIACVVAIVSPILRIYNRTVAIAEEQSIAINIAGLIAHEIQHATNVEITNEGKTLVLDGIEYTTQDGQLVSSNNLVFDPVYYGGSKIDVLFENNENDPFISIKVTVFRENTEKYSYNLLASPLVFLGLDEEGEEPEYGYEAGDLAFIDENGRAVYLSGTWELTKLEAANNTEGNGTNLVIGTLYRDQTGIYAVIHRNPFFLREDAKNDPTLEEASQLGSLRHALVEVNPKEKVLTSDDYIGSDVWKVPITKGRILEYGEKLYICWNPWDNGKAHFPPNAGSWIELIQPKMQNTT